MSSTDVDIDGLRATRHVVDAGAVRLAVHELGAGEPVVLLHGGGPGASAIGNFRGNLEALAAHFRVFAVDMPGYGGSDKPDYDEPYQGFAATSVVAGLRALGVERVSLLGNSLGGGVAVHIAVMLPHFVDKLILIGAAGAAPSFIVPSPSEGTRHLTGFYAPPGPSPERMEDFMRVMLYDHSLINNEMVEQRYQEAIDPEVREGVEKVYSALAGGASVTGEEIWKRVPDVKQQTLLIWGRDDRMLPLDGALYMLSRMQNSRLHVFARCGHWAQLEHRDEFNRLIIDFVSH
jgi:pimeloyl-ACP methyl ester carboxylesterase